MASDEHHIDDLDDDEDDSEEQHQLKQQIDDEDEEFDDVLEEEEEEEDDLNNLNSVTVAVPPPSQPPPPQITTGPLPNIHPHHLQQQSPVTTTPTTTTTTPPTAVKPLQQQPLDETRKLFQRLWTDEDEIELLQGFLEYTTQKGTTSSQHHHYDSTVFYDQIKSKLQLDFNKNQLVEKLRRLKKKYRNVVSRMGSGKEFLFKTPHDQATFLISRKIWCDITPTTAGVVGAEEGGFDDEEPNNPNLQQSTVNLNFNNTSVNSNHNHHGNSDNGIDANSAEKKASFQRSRKRPRVKVEEKEGVADKGTPYLLPIPSPSINGLVEETVRSCLSPLFKELLSNAVNGPCAGGARGFGAGLLSSIPLSFNCSSSVGNLLGGEVVDEKWRKQQILELEVYSKRLELVQEQVKETLEELRSAGT